MWCICVPIMILICELIALLRNIATGQSRPKINGGKLDDQRNFA